MNIEFTKMHGLGNDFVVINNMNGRITLSPEQIIFLCNRHKGIGADGVILVESSSQADCFMNYYNSDGTVAEMCGNGVRCTAKFLKDEILPKNNKNVFAIDTRAGVKYIRLQDDDTYSVNMGKPVFSHSDFPENSVEIEGLKLDFVSMGNPHAIALVESVASFNLDDLGPKIENNKIFPNKINFHLVEKIADDELRVVTWERGCGATLACGTGACAVYALMFKDRESLSGSEVVLHLPGGDLFMSETNDGDIIMRGPAESVFVSMVEV